MVIYELALKVHIQPQLPPDDGIKSRVPAEFEKPVADKENQGYSGRVKLCGMAKELM